MSRHYGSPAAFRAALTSRLQNLAQTSPWTLPQLQRQFAYDRLLARLYLDDQDWILKGATALLAREIGVRGSLDIDVHRNMAREQAIADSGSPLPGISVTGFASSSARRRSSSLGRRAHGSRSLRTSVPRSGRDFMWTWSALTSS